MLNLHPNSPLSDIAFLNYQRSRQKHWNLIAETRRPFLNLRSYYHRRLADVYRQVIQPGKRVLEIGCGQGDLLNAVEPSFGVGVDFSLQMLVKARQKHPHLWFVAGDAHAPCLEGAKFDFIILSDLLNDAWDVQTIFESLASLCHTRTRIVINVYSRLWELPLALAKKLRLAKPVLYQNWLTLDDTRNLMRLGGLEIVRTWQEILAPLHLPLLTNFCNKYLARFVPLNHLCLSNFILARPTHAQAAAPQNPSVSIVVPARNEAGNIARIFDSLPEFGARTEVIFVEGNSSDDTYSAIKNCTAAHPRVNAQLLQQTGRGKGDAVRLGFEHATGDILMILDADLTVPASYLPRFYEAICSGKGEFINGVRLVYPMEKQAMRFANLMGNKFFSLAFSWLLGQPVKDTLCGTKVLWREDYQRIARNRSYFGDFDPFGDFDLLFGAARLGLKIIDMPIRYRDRTYGTTNISRWKHGLLLLRMVLFGAKRLKFT